MSDGGQLVLGRQWDAAFMADLGWQNCWRKKLPTVWHSVQEYKTWWYVLDLLIVAVCFFEYHGDNLVRVPLPKLGAWAGDAYHFSGPCGSLHFEFPTPVIHLWLVCPFHRNDLKQLKLKLRRVFKTHRKLSENYNTWNLASFSFKCKQVIKPNEKFKERLRVC